MLPNIFSQTTIVKGMSEFSGPLGKRQNLLMFPQRDILTVQMNPDYNTSCQIFLCE